MLCRGTQKKKKHLDTTTLIHQCRTAHYRTSIRLTHRDPRVTNRTMRSPARSHPRHASSRSPSRRVGGKATSARAAQESKRRSYHDSLPINDTARPLPCQQGGTLTQSWFLPARSMFDCQAHTANARGSAPMLRCQSEYTRRGCVRSSVVYIASIRCASGFSERSVHSCPQLQGARRKGVIAEAKERQMGRSPSRAQKGQCSPPRQWEGFTRCTWSFASLLQKWSRDAAMFG
ncbi:hypothetical protein VTK26DRAFT_2748 [Humicola hyalothermophila]